MNRRRFLETASVATAVSATAGVLTSCKDDAACTLKPGEILHTVAFSLKHGKESDATNAFLSDGKKILTSIPVVRNFQVFRQTSPKCTFDFGFSMVFTNRTDFETYNNHPDHVSFVKERWETEVSGFQETDYESL
ncbi:MAG: Dabb family protein [Parabacteroides sp.]|jgi:hypothetical protein|uniref:Stress responsive A/B Barrel Domain n=2 Tax=Bacteroidales TaxID=171549 RepID=A0A1T5BQZ9_9BACT|nr:MULTISPECIES: Dabb family protein [Bacteroidales]MBP7938987.1 Dabb family protein [Parabacteroides sp.]HAD01828.1 stress responsive protein [Porphyromonadaceae bacterium]MBP8012264.1 Dabb family protein [Parabacteroides sp.]MBP8026305.1 Dabb family protein [Parabacteroides sp.]MDD3255482.1 Dabb family protein [Parabacteroides sp.]